MIFNIFFVTLTMAKTEKRHKTIMKKAIVYIFIILIITGLIFLGKKLFFAASVNGQLISRLSVIKELEKQGGKTTLDTIILKTLINQEGKKRNISVSENEVNMEISKVEKNIASQGATLDDLLQQQGMTKKDLTDEIKLQLLVTKMATSNISVTDKEIDDYLASQKDQSTLELTKDQAKEAIKQQKLQEKIQTFVADLKSKAKINYFIKY
ncbi:hypothetical protein CO008_00725 [Candidatus Roizmanbacteria bacterium CG_4_8_14_3_um_filter_36_12]|nr:MAG: hypothetical protein CO008_00725 [Candidatus Roizmanbacteria bacterium CG_4_8_14_3_um_filter_36_12]